MNTALDQRIAKTENKVITFKPTFGSVSNLYLQPPKDSSGNMVGVYQVSEEEKRFATTYVKDTDLVVIKPGFQLDLSSLRDAMRWRWIQHCHGIAMSKEEALRQEGVYYYVHDEEAEQRKKSKRNSVVLKAMNYVGEAADGKLSEIALLLGERLDHMSTESLKGYLFDKAQSKNINEIYDLISAFEDPDAKFKILLKKLVEKGIIRNNNEVYRLGETIIGRNFDQATAYLQDPKNKDVVKSLDRRLSPHRYDDTGELDPIFINE